MLKYCTPPLLHGACEHRASTRGPETHVVPRAARARTVDDPSRGMRLWIAILRPFEAQKCIFLGPCRCPRGWMGVDVAVILVTMSPQDLAKASPHAHRPYCAAVIAISILDLYTDDAQSPLWDCRRHYENSIVH